MVLNNLKVIFYKEMENLVDIHLMLIVEDPLIALFLLKNLLIII
jgi:hypothetical protein